MTTQVVIRRLKFSDIPQAMEVEKAAWQPHCSDKYVFKPEQLQSQIETFPEGALGAFVGDSLVGFVITEIVSSQFVESVSTWDEMTDNGYIKRAHSVDGDTMYGVDLSVHPRLAPWGVSKLLLYAEGKLAIKMSLKRIILGGRIPRYYKYADKMAAEQYVYATHPKSGKPLDPELQLYLKSGLKIIKILSNYMPDPESMNFGVLLEWKNPFYDATKHFKPLGLFLGSIARFSNNRAA